MIELIPAIDLIGGHCVRLSRGDYDSRTTYDADPVDVAREAEDHGVRRLHVVDLDGAASRHVVNHKTLNAIARATNLVIDFGGGVKTDEDLRIAFDNGAQMITAGSIAVSNPDTVARWLEVYGPERIILGADTRRGKIAVNGWKDEAETGLTDFLKHYVSLGVSRVISTDIERDGMLEGPAISLYKDILSSFPDLELIASGGVKNMGDVFELQAAGVPGVIFGKALYEGRITWKEIETFIIDNNA